MGVAHRNQHLFAGLTAYDASRRLFLEHPLEGRAHLVQVRLRLRLDRHLQRRHGEVERRQGVAVLPRGRQRVSRPGNGQLRDRPDLTGVELPDRFLVLAVEQEQLAQALVLAAGRVPGVSLALECPGEHAQEGQPADERVGRGLEDSRHQRSRGVRHDPGLLAALGIGDHDLAEIRRRRQVAHDRLGQCPHADVLGRAADQDRRHNTRPNGFLDACLQLGVGDLLALQVLGHHVVVGLGGGLDQLIAAGGDFVRQAGRYRDLGLFPALKLVGLAVDDVHEAGERLSGTDRHVQGRDLLPERGPELVDRGARVRVLPVALVDEEESRPAGLARHRDRGLESRLYVSGGVHQQDRRVCGRKSLDDLGREVGVSGSVDQLDPRPLVIQRADGEAQRLASLLLFRFVVQAGRPVVDAAKPGDRPGIEEETFAQRRLAGTGVRGYDDAAKVGEVDTLGRHLRNRTSGGIGARRTGGVAGGGRGQAMIAGRASWDERVTTQSAADRPPGRPDRPCKHLGRYTRADVRSFEMVPDQAPEGRERRKTRCRLHQDGPRDQRRRPSRRG